MTSNSRSVKSWAAGRAMGVPPSVERRTGNLVLQIWFCRIAGIQRLVNAGIRTRRSRRVSTAGKTAGKPRPRANHRLFFMDELSLVTGGAGFIGSHLVETLTAQGRRVRVLDDFSTGLKSNLESFR